MAPAPPPGSDRSAATVEERTPRAVLRRPTLWASDAPADADARVSGDGVVVTIRSRPSDNSIADEHLALLGRLPGADDGVLVVGADPWTTAGAPARLVEYSRPGAEGATFVSHLLIATGRHRVEVVAERPLRILRAADDQVFDVLDSVRATEHVRGVDLLQETFPPLPTPTITVGDHVGSDAFSVLQGLAGRRWNPATMRAPGAKQLIETGLVGRFGTLPGSTTELLAPWAASAEPITLEQRTDSGARSRIRAWTTPEQEGWTVADGTDDVGYEVGVVSTDDVVTLLAERLGVRPSWTWAFRTPDLPAQLLAARLDGSPAGLPAAFSGDETLDRFWTAEWTVAHLRRGGGRTSTLVHAAGVGHARVGRTQDGRTAFRAEASANVYRSIAAALVG